MVLKRLQRLFGGDPEAEARESLERARREALERRREWEEACAELADEIEALRKYEDLADETDPECPIITKRGEEVLLVCHGPMLTETRRTPKARYGGPFAWPVDQDCQGCLLPAERASRHHRASSRRDARDRRRRLHRASRRRTRRPAGHHPARRRIDAPDDVAHIMLGNLLYSMHDTVGSSD